MHKFWLMAASASIVFARGRKKYSLKSPESRGHISSVPLDAVVLNVCIRDSIHAISDDLIYWSGRMALLSAAPIAAHRSVPAAMVLLENSASP